MNKDQERSWKKAEKESSAERQRLLEETRNQVVALLKKSRDDISLLLAGQSTEYQQWRLPELNREIDRMLATFGDGAGQTLSTAAGSAWAGGVAAIDKPLVAVGLSNVAPHLDDQQLMGMRAFMVERIKDVGTSAASKIKQELGLAMIGSQSVHDTITKVAGLVDGGKDRATTIVRTELSRAWAVASHERALQTDGDGTPMDKIWRRSGKLYPRQAHLLADGRRVPIDQPFTINGHQIRFPHDPKAPASETINCGCICLYRPREIKETLPDHRPFTEQEIAMNPDMAQLASGKSINDPGSPFAGAAISRSVQDAEQLASALGVAQVRYQGSLEAANLANDALQILKDRGLAMPDGVLIDAGVFKHFGYLPGEADAMFAPIKDGRKMIFLDPASAHWAAPDKVAADEFAAGWWSSDHRLHPIFHEAGHLAHYAAAPKNYLQLYSAATFPPGAVDQIAGQVSGYAMTTPVEFVAEVFAGLIASRVYPQSVLSWYRQFGGVIP